jgi:hypothetical protein
MIPTRTELLLAWMTIAKVRIAYGQPELDAYDQAILLDVLKTLDKLQKNEGLRSDNNLIKIMENMKDEN